jgi:hypothetical protein
MRGTASLPRPGIKIRTVCSTIELVASPASPFEGRSSSESEPRRPASPSDIRQHDPPEGERTAATSEVSWISRPVATTKAMTAEAIDPVCSAAFREVGGRRRGDPRVPMG